MYNQKRYQAMTSTYLLKKDYEEELLTLLKGMLKPITNTQMTTTLEKPSTFIAYLGKNNLYGWAMSQYLPYGGFKWLKNVDGFDVMSISEKSPIGYFLEVDLKYLDELRELHNDYPLAPEKLAVSSDMLSKYF